MSGGPDIGAMLSSQASPMSAAPVTGALNGGRVFGILGDTQGILPGGGMQGIMGKQILNGGLFGIANSGQKAPGILAQMGLSVGAICDDLRAKIKQDPGIQAFAQQMNMSGGVQEVPIGPPVAPTGGIPMAASADGPGIG